MIITIFAFSSVPQFGQVDEGGPTADDLDLDLTTEKGPEDEPPPPEGDDGDDHSSQEIGEPEQYSNEVSNCSAISVFFLIRKDYLVILKPIV